MPEPTLPPTSPPSHRAHPPDAIVRDITDRKRADCDLCRQKELLAESEKRYRLLAENASDIIAVFNAEGIRTYVSPSVRTLGYEPQELMGRHGYEIVHPDDRARLKATHLAVLENGHDENVILRILRKDGSSVPMETTTRAVRDRASGRIIEIQTHSRDVSDRLATQQRTAWLLEKLISAQEEERRHIARELHDDTGQALTSLLVGLRTLEDVQSLEAAQARARDLRHLVTRTLEDVRRLASGLRPAVLDDLGLHAALDRFVRDFADSHRVEVEFEAESQDLAGLSPPMETAIFRIVQEALANVARHARASSARVLVDRPPDALELIIEDDGQGFDAPAALHSDRAGRGMGLLSMRERAALLGGSLTIESAFGRGTTIALRLPLS